MDEAYFEMESSVQGRNLEILGKVTNNHIEKGIEDLIEKFILCSSLEADDVNLDQTVDQIADVVKIRLEFSKDVSDEMFLCCFVCQGIMVEPVTLTCGHSFSKPCIFTPGQAWTCPKCGMSYSDEYIVHLKTNVVLRNMLEKFYPKAFEAWRLCNKGLEQMNDYPCDISEAISSFKEALRIDPIGHLPLALLCNALYAYGKESEALENAENVIQFCPNWAKGYFLKGEILMSLGKLTESAKNFLIAYSLDPNALTAKSNVRKLLHNLFHKMAQNSEQKQLFKRQRSLDKIQSQFQKLLDDIIPEARSIQCPVNIISKGIDSSLLEKVDFECPLCMRLLWEPVSTSCGHTFCRNCLVRWLDHRPTCPLCKTSLSSYVADRIQNVTEIIDIALRTLLPKDYAERNDLFNQEMEELCNAGKGPEHIIPLFICTVAYPFVPCPLHIFEPRYRLMIRQCIESGSREFGMCAFMSTETEDCIADVGTMLYIRHMEYLPDGRSLVDTIGRQRFKILRRGMRDGYNIGAVEFLRDIPPQNEADIQETKYMHDLARKLSESWYCKLSHDRKQSILAHFGPMPTIDEDYINSPDGPYWYWWMLAVLPLGTQIQSNILRITSLRVRFQMLHMLLVFIKQKNKS